MSDAAQSGLNGPDNVNDVLQQLHEEHQTYAAIYEPHHPTRNALWTAIKCIEQLERAVRGRGAAVVLTQEIIAKHEATKDRVRALIDEGHHGQHEPGPDLHGFIGPCWPCEIHNALYKEAVPS